MTFRLVTSKLRRKSRVFQSGSRPAACSNDRFRTTAVSRPSRFRVIRQHGHKLAVTRRSGGVLSRKAGETPLRNTKPAALG